MSEISLHSLQGRRILVTRASEQAGLFSAKLRDLGAEPIEFPTIRIVPPEDWGPLDRALERLLTPGMGYRWLAFTSANGVRFLEQRLISLGYIIEQIRESRVRIVAIGPATTKALREIGLEPDLQSAEAVGEAVAAALIADARRHKLSIPGQRVLLPRAAIARQEMVQDLQQAGLHVDDIPVYRTLPVEAQNEPGQQILALLREQAFDILTFTSSSTVRNFLLWLQSSLPAGVSPLELLRREPEACIASIGPITSRTLREAGLPPHIEASTFTTDGLIEAMCRYYEGKNDRADN